MFSDRLQEKTRRDFLKLSAAGVFGAGLSGWLPVLAKAAESGKKDDRVMAAALTHECYRRRMQQKLVNLGETLEHALKRATGDQPNAAEKMALNYLRSVNINLLDSRRSTG